MTIVNYVHRPKRAPRKKRKQPAIVSRIVTPAPLKPIKGSVTSSGRTRHFFDLKTGDGFRHTGNAKPLAIGSAIRHYERHHELDKHDAELSISPDGRDVPGEQPWGELACKLIAR